MTTVLTTHKFCPKCGTEATVEVDGIIGTYIMMEILLRLDKEGGMLTASCGHRFYVEPKPKKPSFFQRLKNTLNKGLTA